jgi:alcohol dehydrogenase (cytochrome c)
MRKVAMTAARNGYFFVVDRDTGEHLLTFKFSQTANWARPLLSSKGQPMRIVEKDFDTSGALISPDSGGASNWIPASFSPDYGLYFASVADPWSLRYRYDARGGGKGEMLVDATCSLAAIDPELGAVVWRIRYPSCDVSYNGLRTNGVLTTSGRLLFAGDTNGNLVARDPQNGKPLWHVHLGRISNAPETYMVSGRQYILVAAGDMLYAFRLASVQ